MISCHRDEVARFLAGRLSPAEESTFVDHLETCLCCRDWLEEDSGSHQDWQWARELLSLFSRSCGLASTVGRAARGRRTGETAWLSEIVGRRALSFLAPSDDPAMMGRVGPYEVSGFLGRGATGIVLKGFDRALNRNVAIKVLDPAVAGAGTARQRFAREARAMAAISHEQVMPVYGVDDHAGLPYFIMEYVAGGSLERRLNTDGSLDVVSIVRIGLQVAQALAEAHRHGLVHRDIKPANILIDRGTERVRVADFGLARVANDASCTHSGLIAGTPQYMAPEQILGETCTARIRPLQPRGSDVRHVHGSCSLPCRIGVCRDAADRPRAPPSDSRAEPADSRLAGGIRPAAPGEGQGRPLHLSRSVCIDSAG